MRKDLTEVVMLVDKSGSMNTRQADAEGGLNSFIDEMKKSPGETRFSLIFFDTQYRPMYQNISIHEVPHCRLVPGGGTALLDATARAIDETGARLRDMPEYARPGLVVFVIITDGEELDSRIFNLDQVKQRIQHQQQAYNWQFTFLGANQDSFQAARGMGIYQDAAANYAGSKGASRAFKSAAANVTRMRAATLAGHQVMCAYSGAELQSMADGPADPKPPADAQAYGPHGPLNNQWSKGGPQLSGK